MGNKSTTNNKLPTESKSNVTGANNSQNSLPRTSPGVQKDEPFTDGVSSQNSDDQRISPPGGPSIDEMKEEKYSTVVNDALHYLTTTDPLFVFNMKLHSVNGILHDNDSEDSPLLEYKAPELAAVLKATTTLESNDTIIHGTDKPNHPVRIVQYVPGKTEFFIEICREFSTTECKLCSLPYKGNLMEEGFKNNGRVNYNGYVAIRHMDEKRDIEEVKKELKKNKAALLGNDILIIAPAGGKIVFYDIKVRGTCITLGDIVNAKLAAIFKILDGLGKR